MILAAPPSVGFFTSTICKYFSRRNLSEPLAGISFHCEQERETVRPEDGNHLFSPGNVVHPEPQVNPQDRLSLSGNDRLPGAVLLARERLLQRLRGVMLSDSRLVRMFEIPPTPPSGIIASAEVTCKTHYGSQLLIRHEPVVLYKYDLHDFLHTSH